MRTWSVSGTAFALCTRSSSLSMSTSTSMGDQSTGWTGLLLWVEGSAWAAAGVQLGEARRDFGRHELLHIPAEGGNLLHAARGHEAELRARHHVHGLDVRRERPVQMVHLELPLEVRNCAEALHHRRRAPAAGEVDDQLGKHVHLHVAVLVQGVAEELDAFLDGEHGPLVVGVADDADDN